MLNDYNNIKNLFRDKSNNKKLLRIKSNDDYDTQINKIFQNLKFYVEVTNIEMGTTFGIKFIKKKQLSNRRETSICLVKMME